MLKRSYRPIVRGKKWAIAARNALASQAGELIFLKCGDAVDAVIASLATLGVTEPAMSGAFSGSYLINIVDSGMSIQEAIDAPEQQEFSPMATT